MLEGVTLKQSDITTDVDALEKDPRIIGAIVAWTVPDTCLDDPGTRQFTPRDAVLACQRVRLPESIVPALGSLDSAFARTAAALRRAGTTVSKLSRDTHGRRYVVVGSVDVSETGDTLEARTECRIHLEPNGMLVSSDEEAPIFATFKQFFGFFSTKHDSASFRKMLTNIFPRLVSGFRFKGGTFFIPSGGFAPARAARDVAREIYPDARIQFLPIAESEESRDQIADAHEADIQIRAEQFLARHEAETATRATRPKTIIDRLQRVRRMREEVIDWQSRLGRELEGSMRVVDQLERAIREMVPVAPPARKRLNPDEAVLETHVEEETEADDATVDWESALDETGLDDATDVEAADADSAESDDADNEGDDVDDLASFLMQ